MNNTQMAIIASALLLVGYPASAAVTEFTVARVTVSKSTGWLEIAGTIACEVLDPSINNYWGITARIVQMRGSIITTNYADSQSAPTCTGFTQNWALQGDPIHQNGEKLIKSGIVNASATAYDETDGRPDTDAAAKLTIIRIP
jgi:hypothetical protein